MLARLSQPPHLFPRRQISLTCSTLPSRASTLPSWNFDNLFIRFLWGESIPTPLSTWRRRPLRSRKVYLGNITSWKKDISITHLWLLGSICFFVDQSNEELTAPHIYPEGHCSFAEVDHCGYCSSAVAKFQVKGIFNWCEDHTCSRLENVLYS